MLAGASRPPGLSPRSVGPRDGTRHLVADVDRDVADMWPREEERTLGPPRDPHPGGSYAVWKLVSEEAPLMPTKLQYHPGSPLLRSLQHPPTWTQVRASGERPAGTWNLCGLGVGAECGALGRLECRCADGLPSSHLGSDRAGNGNRPQTAVVRVAAAHRTAPQAHVSVWKRSVRWSLAR